MSFLDRLTRGLQKTRDTLLEQVGGIVPGLTRSLSPEDFERLEAALLTADAGPATTDRILEGVRRRLADRAFRGAPLDALRVEIESLLSDSGSGASGGGASAARTDRAPTPEAPRPRVILAVGANGSGKTTSLAKLAHRFRAGGEHVLLVAADTFRAAAADQLEVWGSRVGAEVVSASPGADPASVAFDGVQRAKSRGADRVLIDTAGRLHVKENLMEELKKVQRVLGRALPGAPHEVLLVLDATTGQNGLEQARVFDRALGLTGLVLTKLDGTAKGGVVLAIVQGLSVPIQWIGVGEGLEDMLPFEPGAFAAALLAPGAGG